MRGQAVYRAKQALGQHFLRDEALLDELVALAGIGPEDSVFEIGPGMGDLTLALARRAKSVLAMEIDPDLMPILSVRLHGLDHVQVIQGDAMEADLPTLLKPLGSFKVVANLPYYITTPLINLLLRLPLPVLSIHVMVQKEAAERILAQPSTPAYGPLALLAQWRAKSRLLRVVEARQFSPAPKSDSAFVGMIIRDEPPCAVRSEERLFRLIAAGFRMRRKTLLNNLMPAFSLSREQAQAALEQAGLHPTVRAEALSLCDFARLSNVLN